MRRGDRFDANAQNALDTVLARFKALWEQDVRSLATVDFALSGTPNTAPVAVATFVTDPLSRSDWVIV